MTRQLRTGPELVGIVNVTADSFSDGGLFLSPDAAVRHGAELLERGATWLDIGAESSNPDGQRVDAATEIARLASVVPHFVRAGARVAVDTHKAEVMRAALDWGAEMINDVTALGDPEAPGVLRAFPDAAVVLMHARNSGMRAERRSGDATRVVDQIRAFFAARLAWCAEQGLQVGRFILDPGMGLFLGSNPEPSVAVLRGLPALAALGHPLYVSVSRKSFLGAITGRGPRERGAATLAAELWCAEQRVAYIRTHDPGALRDALLVRAALAAR